MSILGGFSLECVSVAEEDDRHDLDGKRSLGWSRRAVVMAFLQLIGYGEGSENC